MQIDLIIEALLFASPSPVSTEELARLIAASATRQDEEAAARAEEAEEENYETDPELAALAETTEEQIIAAIDSLNNHYRETGRAFEVAERANGWKLFTRSDYGHWVRELFPGKKPSRLSAPALETLAIISYRQPMTKSAIEAVRGVAVDGVLNKLLDRELIKIGGRADLPGRPLLYETTELFLEHFGVKSIDDLPNAAELRQVKLPEPEEETPADGDGDAEGENAEPRSAAEAEHQLALSGVDGELKDDEETPAETPEPTDEDPEPESTTDAETETTEEQPTASS